MYLYSNNNRVRLPVLLSVVLVISSILLSACLPESNPLAPILATSFPDAVQMAVAQTQTAQFQNTVIPLDTLQPSQNKISGLSSAPPSVGQYLSDQGVFLYYVQAGDTLDVVAKRFGVPPESIQSEMPLRTPGLLDAGISMKIPGKFTELPWSQWLLPDSEVVYSQSAADFNTQAYVKQAGGYLARTQESLNGVLMDASGVVAQVAEENSINPRLLLAMLEYECHCVLEEPGSAFQAEYIMGLDNRYGLYHQLVWAAEQLSDGYYGWRSGNLTELALPGGEKIRLAPTLNAGSVALMNYFVQYETLQKGQINTSQDWSKRMNPETGFIAQYQQMFGQIWERAAGVEPLFPPDLSQPLLQFPFEIGTVWSFSSGPHWAWEHSGPLAAIDLAPGSVNGGCVASPEWVVAAADGLVVRAERGFVLQDLDGDGIEQTGWVLLYLHVDFSGTVKVGDFLHASDHIGHPACIGGPSTGTHLHFARKYNGEWISAKDAVPMILDGWIVRAGKNPYEGTMTSGGQTCIASPLSPATSWILRPAGGK